VPTPMPMAVITSVSRQLRWGPGRSELNARRGSVEMVRARAVAIERPVMELMSGDGTEHPSSVEMVWARAVAIERPVMELMSADWTERARAFAIDRPVTERLSGDGTERARAVQMERSVTELLSGGGTEHPICVARAVEIERPVVAKPVAETVIGGRNGASQLC
jgi:hypothetical protein